MAFAEGKIAVPADLLQSSSGLALDIGGSLAKLVYRSKKDYCNGEPIDSAQHPEGMGYVQVMSFPKEQVDTYIQYIKQHVDFTGDPPVVNSCGFGALEHRDRLEKGLNIKLNIKSEIQCNSNGIRTLLKDDSFTEHYDVFTTGIFEDCFTHINRHLFFAHIASGLTIPDKDKFEVELRKAVKAVESMKAEELHLPILVAMCGSACPFFTVDVDGSVQVVEATMLSGLCFSGMATAMTGEKDWDTIMKMTQTHDGESVYSYFDPQHLNIDFDNASKNLNNDGMDIPAATAPVMWIPFGNLQISSKENHGDKLRTLFEMVCTNIAMLAYNVALANGMKQVLFCGSFGSVPSVKQIITRQMIMTNTSAYFKDKMDRIIDFRFVRNGGHLCALGAFLADK